LTLKSWSSQIASVGVEATSPTLKSLNLLISGGDDISIVDEGSIRGNHAISPIGRLAPLV